MAIEFMPMAQDLELVARRDLDLGLLDHLALEFLDLPAFDTNEMIVVLLLDFVSRDAIVEAAFCRDARFDQKLHRSIDRGVSDVGVLPSHALIEIFTRDMPLRLEKYREDEITLLRVFEVILLKVGGERLHLYFVRHGGRISLSAPSFPDKAARKSRFGSSSRALRRRAIS